MQSNGVKKVLSLGKLKIHLYTTRVSRSLAVIHGNLISSLNHAYYAKYINI